MALTWRAPYNILCSGSAGIQQVVVLAVLRCDASVTHSDNGVVRLAARRFVRLTGLRFASVKLAGWRLRVCILHIGTFA